MRVGPQPIIARPAWYDRNPSGVFLSYVMAGVTPHSRTQRFLYMVPTGRKAMLEFAIAKVIRYSAATTPSFATAEIAAKIENVGPNSFLYATISSNTIGASDSTSVGQSILLKAGDNLIGYTEDLSTGGAVTYILVAKLTEFDA